MGRASRPGPLQRNLPCTTTGSSLGRQLLSRVLVHVGCFAVALSTREAYAAEGARLDGTLFIGASPVPSPAPQHARQIEPSLGLLCGPLAVLVTSQQRPPRAPLPGAERCDRNQDTALPKRLFHYTVLSRPCCLTPARVHAMNRHLVLWVCVLLLGSLLATPARADLAPMSASEAAEWERLRLQAEQEAASCTLQRHQGPGDTCFTCSGDFPRNGENACEIAFSLYGFVRSCVVHSAYTMPQQISHTLVCRAEQDGLAPLPCSSRTAIESLTVELDDHPGLCTRAAQQKPDEQCVRCSASPEDCQQLAASGFSARCEAVWARGNRRAALWCRPHSATQAVRCADLARLNQPPYTGSTYLKHRELAEEPASVAASYAPPASGAVSPVPPSTQSRSGTSGAHCAARPSASADLLWLASLALLMARRRKLA